MSIEAIKKHHQLEAKLHRLRLLRDLKHPDFKEQDEDKVLDEMEKIWNSLTSEEQQLLESARRILAFSEYSPDMPDLPATDVALEKWLQGLPARVREDSIEHRSDSDQKSGLSDISKITDVIKSGGQVPLKNLSMRLHEDESDETPDFIKFDPDECQSPETCGICHTCQKSWVNCQCEKTPDDIDEFKKFFGRMGVIHREDLFAKSKYGNARLSPGQAHFWFRDGKFTGVEWDEMGHFDPRK